MNLIVVGPHMEERPLPQYALRPIPDNRLTALETLVARVGKELCNIPQVTILGIPWVNPRGRSKQTASLEDYLNDPVVTRRLLEVAFLAPRADWLAERAVIAANATFRPMLTQTQDWVREHLSPRIAGDCVLWHIFDPSLESALAHSGASTAASAYSHQGDELRGIHLRGTNVTLDAFCGALAKLFE